MLKCLRSIVTREIGPHSELLEMVITKKFKWFDHVIRYNTISKTFFQCTIYGKSMIGRPKMQWQDNILEWTVLGLEEAMLKMKNREGSKTIIKKSTLPLRRYINLTFLQAFMYIF